MPELADQPHRQEQTAHHGEQKGTGLTLQPGKTQPHKTGNHAKGKQSCEPAEAVVFRSQVLEPIGQEAWHRQKQADSGGGGGPVIPAEPGVVAHAPAEETEPRQNACSQNDQGGVKHTAPVQKPAFVKAMGVQVKPEDQPQDAAPQGQGFQGGLSIFLLPEGLPGFRRGALFHNPGRLSEK